MLGFRTLVDLVDYIRNESIVNSYVWNNEAGDWDLEDISVNAEMYDYIYSFYYLDLNNYNILDEEFNALFGRIR